MKKSYDRGFTIPEMIVTIVVFGFIASSAYMLLLAHISASSDVRLRAAGLSLATEQVEYLRSLPYDSLAVQGGSTVTSATPIPSTQDKTRADRTFVVRTDIRYADDAFDGCLDYGSAQTQLCRNYKSSTPLTDTNPRDYKVADVTVTDKNTGRQFSKLSSQFTSRVAETAGNASAIFATVLDGSGSPVAGANVRVRNTALTPAVDQTITTDTNGVALFLDVVPDSSPRYVISASKTGFSTLTTIAANGSLTPTYPNLNAIPQRVSSTTLRIDEVSSDSLEIALIDEAGAALNGASVTLKGGLKLYTDPDDDAYSYQQTVTAAAGTNIIRVGSLVPGEYRVCHDLAAANNCGSSPSRKILALRTAYGAASYQPFTVSAGSSSAVDGGPMQRVVAVVSTSSTLPRLHKIDPNTVSTGASDASDIILRLTGANLSGATVRLRQGVTEITGTVTGSDSSTSIQREFNLSGINQGAYEMIITNASGSVVQTGAAPGNLGGINVTP